MKPVPGRLQPPSEPPASQTAPVATLTAAPPHVRSVFQGFRVAPNTGLVVLAPIPSSGTFDFATGIAPLLSNVSTPMSDRSAT
jgi:hypothetical protein